MVRFSCFLPHVNYHRSKKVVQHSAEVMSLNPEEGSQGQVIKASFCSDHNRSSASAEQITSPSSHGGCWKSEDLSGNTCPDDGKDFLQTVRLKKSMSLGSVLDKRRGFSGEDLTEDDEMDREFSFDYSHDDNLKRVADSFDNAGSAEVNAVAESFDLVDPVHPESLFSIGVLKQSDGEQHYDVGERSTDPVVESLHLSSNTLPLFAKSHSLTNIRMDTANSDEGTLTNELTGPRSRSFEDLYSLREGRDESLNGDDTVCSEIAFQRYIAAPYYHDTTEASYLDGKGSQCHADSGEECHLSNASGGFDEVADRERQDEYSSEKFEWREPDTDGVVVKENLQQDSSNQSWDELTSEEFNIKRIEQWISQIDIQNGNVVEELGESSRSVPKKDHRVVAGVTSARLGSNSLGMELAYNYISSLTPTSSSAQMSNLGLVAVPFLSAFVSLRVLNLSGNAIVRITSGALPRGLHMLNLSKNNIAAIEGLRDLTRLRVLDLSYNRIVRIGHGLASCSSLKELYLAGNKISEVEGLHRLLKLNVLDLRLNKISTAKGLGQLAANYASLQAINLEGNPAQRNVGDEQLKKYLLSLLPHLVYFNKQAIRASGLKEISDRPPRSITTSHQFDRGMRTEQNHSRRGATHGSALHRSSSSNHSRSNPAAAIASSKQSKNHRHVRLLPPSGSKATSNHPADTGTKLLSLKPINPIRRSLSEGTL